MAEPAVGMIDIISDVVCPWCYIGKRRIEQAIQRRGDAARPRLHWLPFQLNPDLPLEGVDRRAYLEAKFGGPQQAAEIYARVRAAGAEVGIAFEFERIERQPNTILAHRLIAWAQQQRSAEPLVERLFGAYFLEGRFIGALEVLVQIADEAGLDARAAEAFLASDDGVQEVRAADTLWRERGISGVPLFLFNGKVGVSGAQSAEVLLRAWSDSEKAA